MTPRSAHLRWLLLALAAPAAAGDFEDGDVASWWGEGAPLGMAPGAVVRVDGPGPDGAGQGRFGEAAGEVDAGDLKALSFPFHARVGREVATRGHVDLLKQVLPAGREVPLLAAGEEPGWCA